MKTQNKQRLGHWAQIFMDCWRADMGVDCYSADRKSAGKLSFALPLPAGDYFEICYCLELLGWETKLKAPEGEKKHLTLEVWRSLDENS